MKYTLKNIIGEGACGTVYKAVNENNESVSIKIIPKSKNPRDEMKILSTLRHDNILKFIDVYETSNSTCLVTELCEYSLITFINEYNVDINISKKIIRMILCGLEYLHSNNIIHRDIKLANILIKENSVKICDFGLSCYENKNNFSVCGTEDYIAPEIINKLMYTKSVDIYSAGKVFKTLLSLKNERDFESFDLLSRMLESNPLKRITSYDALRHPVFKEFLPKFCDYRYIKNFKVNEKFGIIEKRNNKVYFDETSVEIFDIKSKSCQHNGALKENSFNLVIDKSIIDKSRFYNIDYEDLQTLRFVFKQDNKAKDIFLFTNSELKKIIYGMAYLNLKMERLPVIIIEDPNFKFSYLLNDGFSYYEANFMIKKKFEKKGKLKNDKFVYEVTDLLTKSKNKYEILPADFRDRNLDELYTKCKRNLINVNFDCLPLIIRSQNNEFSKNSNFSQSNQLLNCNEFSKSRQIFNPLSSLGTFSSVGSVLDLKIKNENIYKHKSNLGWCIKKQSTFIFLLDDGKCFEIEMCRRFVRYKNERYEINNNLPSMIKMDLKRVRELIRMYI